MSAPIIQVQNLSKLYELGALNFRSIRDSVDYWWAKTTQNELALKTLHRRYGVREMEADDPQMGPRPHTFWALKDVSFEVQSGEVVGVIGRNGSGKSTLLKILSRITEPTSGRAVLRGRVASLLEVGTGFHQDLSGRENIYMNGAILGMRRWEINRKLRKIIEFAEVEKFIDTPVKHYSSGMYLRLAFSVAAHLETDILIVDEILSVGDENFQKKCLGKIDHVAQEGRTVLIVNHNLGQIRRLCKQSLWLDQGMCKQSGETSLVTVAYQAVLNQQVKEPKMPEYGFRSWKILDQTAHTLDKETPFVLQVQLRLKSQVRYGYHKLILKGSDGQNVSGWLFILSLEPGDHYLTYHFPSLPVRSGVYFWHASLWDGGRKVGVNHLTPELIIDVPDHSHFVDEWPGAVNLPCQIEIKAKPM